MASVQPHERNLLLVGVLAALAFLGLGAVVTAGPPPGFDVAISTWATTTFDSGPARAVLDVLNVIGTLEGGAVLTTALAIAFFVTRRPGTSVAILSTWLAELAGAAVKLVLMRERPPGAVVAGVLGESWSYPSGHVVRAVAVVGVLAWLALGSRTGPGADGPAGPSIVPAVDSSRAWRALGAGLVAGAVMGLARLAAGVHWPTDVIGGLLLGAAFVCWFALIAGRVAGRSARGLSVPSTPP